MEGGFDKNIRRRLQASANTSGFLDFFGNLSSVKSMRKLGFQNFVSYVKLVMNRHRGHLTNSASLQSAKSKRIESWRCYRT